MWSANIVNYINDMSIDDKYIYVTVQHPNDQQILCLNKTDGHVENVWHYDDSIGPYSVVVDESSIYITTLYKAELYIFDKQSNQLQRTLPLMHTRLKIRQAKNYFLLWSSRIGHVTIYQKPIGDALNDAEKNVIDSMFATEVAANNEFVCVTNIISDEVYIHDMIIGDLKHKWNMPMPCGVVVDECHIYISCPAEHAIYIYYKNDYRLKTIWRLEEGIRPHTLLVDDVRVYVMDNHVPVLYALYKAV